MRIKRQGEGTAQLQSPFSDDAGTVLAHYYQFAQIFHERKLIKTPEGNLSSKATVYRFPKSFRWRKSPLPAIQNRMTLMCNSRRCSINFRLPGETGNSDELENAIETMRTGLADAARLLIATPLPSGKGDFGPSFQLIS